MSEPDGPSCRWCGFPVDHTPVSELDQALRAERVAHGKTAVAEGEL